MNTHDNSRAGKSGSELLPYVSNSEHLTQKQVCAAVTRLVLGLELRPRLRKHLDDCESCRVCVEWAVAQWGDLEPVLPERCPNDQRLTQYVENQLDADEQVAVARHAKHCDVCRETINAVRDDLTAAKSAKREEEEFAKVVAMSLIVAEGYRRGYVPGTPSAIRDVRGDVPTGLDEVHALLRSERKLDDAEVRVATFQLSRALVRTLGKRITRIEFANRCIEPLDVDRIRDVTDGLLHADASVAGQVHTRQRLIDTARNLQAAFDNDDARTYELTEHFIRCAARLHPARSPERLQLLVTYAVWLWIGQQYDEALEVNGKVVRRVNELAAAKGGGILDQLPAFGCVETLRRVRTYADMNIANCMFFQKFTTATERVFMVSDYEAMVREVLTRSHDALSRDPGSSSFLDKELLIFHAHAYRAAGEKCANVTRRWLQGTALADDPSWWNIEQARQRYQVERLIRNPDKFYVPGNPEMTMRRIADAARLAEDEAVLRTIQIVKSLDRPSEQEASFDGVNLEPESAYNT